MSEKKQLEVVWNKDPGNLEFIISVGDFALDKKEVEKIGRLLKEYDPVLGKMVKKIDEYSKTADSIVIKEPEQEASAINFLKPLKDFRKSIETAREGIVKPINKLVKDINLIFKPRTGIIDEIEKKIKAKLREYRIKVEKAAEAERLKIEEQNRKKAEKHAEKVRKAEEEGKDPLNVKAPVFKEAEVPETSTKTTKGAATFKTVRKYRIEDPEKIPRDYWILDEKKIAKVIKAGVDIPGVTAYEDKEIAIR